jgi:hypothetical protein
LTNRQFARAIRAPAKSSGKITVLPKHPRSSESRSRRECADALAVAALSFLAADDERLMRFLALSGLDVGQLRQAAAEAGFLAGVLAYLVGDEALLLNFAACAGEQPEQVVQAHILLNGPFDG